MKNFAMRIGKREIVLFIGYTFFFIAIVVVGFFPFIRKGKLLVWNCDAIGHYYPAFLYIGEYLREFILNLTKGCFSLPLFDMSIGMGEDIIGSLNYYGFGDPINLLAILANKSNGAYIFTFLYFFRLWLAGIFFYKYCSYMKLDSALSYLGALIYVFSGFALSGGTRYIQFLTPLVYLPLILLGCEKVIKNDKGFLLTLSIAYATLCNFYFLFMVSLFLIVYCTIRMGFVYGIKNIKEMLFVCLKCIVQYVLGLCIAAPIFLPAVVSFLDSERIGLSPLEILSDVNNWIPDRGLLYEFLTGYRIKSDYCYWSEVPILEIFSLSLLFFLPKNKKNIQFILAVVLGIVAWCMPVVSYIASGFGERYTRWVFLLQFTYVIVFIYVFETIKELLKGKIKDSIYIGFIAISVIVNICVNTYYLNAPEGKNWSEEFLICEEVKRYVDSPLNYSDKIERNELFRVSNDAINKCSGRPENIAMINDYNGLTFWFSIVNKNTQQMVNQLGTMDQNNWRSWGLNNSSIYESLAGVKYYLQNDNSNIPLGFEWFDTVYFYDDTWNIYQNKFCLPLGYTYDTSIDINQYNKMNYIDKMQILFQSVVLDKSDGENKLVDYVMDRKEPELKSEKDYWVLKYSVLPEEEAYLFVERNELNDLVGKIFIQEKNKKYVITKSQDVMYGLGHNFNNNQLTILINKEKVNENDIRSIVKNMYLYTYDIEELESSISNLQKESLENIEMKRDTISGTIEVSGKKYMVLRIPYNKNWKAFIDGKETKIYNANTMYMGIELEKGNHSIEFKYVSLPFQIGIVLFVGAILYLIVIQYLDKMKKRKHIS